MSTPHSLVEHLFRHQAGRLTARLVRFLGPARLDLAEESVQDALVKALHVWPFEGIPENPTGWLFRVAHNSAIDALRRRKLEREREDAVLGEIQRSLRADLADPSVEEQLRDDELRMIVLCCHPRLSAPSRVALSLKMVGGFSVREIAAGMLAEDEAVAQQLVRAKRRLRDDDVTLDFPPTEQLPARVDSVLDTLYLMFNGGYAAHEGDNLVREEVCLEALRLARLLASSNLSSPKVHALTALMALKAARFPARTDESGDLILLEQQDPSRWNQHLLAMGFAHFDASIQGTEVSQLHIEAAIAATHARGEPWHWDILADLYDQLLDLCPSPVIALNRAVVTSKREGPAAGLAAAESLACLENYILWHAVRGQLLLELGRGAEAGKCFESALALRCSAPERRFLERKLAKCRASLL